MNDMTRAPVLRRRRVSRRMLPYLLSLPALLTCIGILVPFDSGCLFASAIPAFAAMGPQMELGRKLPQLHDRRGLLEHAQSLRHLCVFDRNL